MDKPIVIAVDGPAGTGKGELCRRLAQHYNFSLLDSGAIYRVLAYAARRAGLAMFDEDSLVQQAMSLNLRFEAAPDGVRPILNGEDVTAGIRTEETGVNASKVAAHQQVRRALLQRQRDFRREPGLVADGRDMGTVVFPDAQAKIFLDASCEVRARRRALQMQRSGAGEVDYQQILRDLRARDERDRTRAVAPLVPAADALILDSSELSIEQTFERALAFTQERLAEAG